MVGSGRLRKPKLSDPAHAELNELLHTMHVQAGSPSGPDMARALASGSKQSMPGMSRSSINDAFSSARLPSLKLVEALVVHLHGAQRVDSSDRHGQLLKEKLEHARQLWMAAEEHLRDGWTADVQTLPQDSGSLAQLRLLTEEEAAEMLNRTVTEVRRMIISGELTAIRVSPRQYRIPPEALKPYLPPSEASLAG